MCFNTDKSLSGKDEKAVNISDIHKSSHHPQDCSRQPMLSRMSRSHLAQPEILLNCLLFLFVCLLFKCLLKRVFFILVLCFIQMLAEPGTGLLSQDLGSQSETLAESSRIEGVTLGLETELMFLNHSLFVPSF